MLGSSSAVFPGASERKSELGWKQSSQSSDWPSHGMLALQAVCHNTSTREALLNQGSTTKPEMSEFRSARGERGVDSAGV